MTGVQPADIPHAALTQVAASRADWSDGAALAIFLAVWLGYRVFVSLLGRRFGAVNLDMTKIRGHWIREMMQAPDRRLMDNQLIGHTLSTTSFFASTNLILIAAVAGAMFGGERTYRSIQDVPLLSHGPRLLFEFKLALVLCTLAAGLLDFVWSIRQINYCLALTGAAPSDSAHGLRARYAEAMAVIFNSALTAFNGGVRAYYFALAAAAWLVGSWAFALASVGALALLLVRQIASPTARGIHTALALIEEAEADQASTPTPMGQTTPVPPMPQ